MDRSQHLSKTESRTLDLSGALSRLRGNRTLLKELISFFLEDYDRALAAIHCATDRRNSQEMQLAAHNLKGLAANFDAQEVVDTATAIELYANENDIQCATKLLPILDDALERLVEELRQYLDQERNDN